MNNEKLYKAKRMCVECHTGYDDILLNILVGNQSWQESDHPLTLEKLFHLP